MRTLDAEVTVAISKAIIQILPVQDDNEGLQNDVELGDLPSEQRDSTVQRGWCCDKCGSLQNEVCRPCILLGNFGER